MNDAEILRLLEEEEEEQNFTWGAPIHQDRVFVIMWQSNKSGGTYTELRKSVRGRNRFLRALKYLGVNLNEVKVFEQPKEWVPQRKTKVDPNKKKGKKTIEEAVR